jgi:GTP-binding protein
VDPGGRLTVARHTIEWDRAAHTSAQLPHEPWPQVAFAGRSNVGKSSLLNRVFGRRLAQVSRTPGKTRSLNFYRVDDAFFLVDLPGYGYAKRAQTERQKFAALLGFFFEHNPRLAGVVQLIDIRHAPSALDLNVSRYLRGLGIDVLTVLTKSDKLSRGAGARQRQAIARDLGLPVDAVVPTCAVDGRGTDEIWSWLSAAIRKARSHVE